jgi:hypothetical protein
MTPSAESFAEAAPGVRSARVPAGPSGPLRECDHLQVYRGRLADGEEVLFVTLSTGASQSRERAFLDAATAWEYDNSDSVATIRRRGEVPVPWVALDVSAEGRAESATGPFPAETVTAMLVDAAEAFHTIAGYTDHPLSTAEHVTVSRRPPSATILPPFDRQVREGPSRQEGSEGARDAVTQLGKLGCRLLGKEATSGSRDGETPHRTVRVIERALATDTYDSPYDLKRALLFGTDEPHATSETGAGRTAAPQRRAAEGANEPTAPPDDEQQAGQEFPEQVTREGDSREVVSRRKAVGLLGFGLLTAGGATAVQSMFGDGSPRSAGGDDGIQVPDTEFEFEIERSTMSIQHVTGDRIDAEKLFIRRPSVSDTDTLAWTDYPGFTDRSTVWVGDSIRIARRVPMGVSILWEQPDTTESVIIDSFSIGEETTE